MKTKLFFIILISVALTGQLAAQSKTVTTHFKVYGNCVMCKKRIETALDHKGIKQANWNVKTKDLEIVYNSSKITELEIHELIANAGHDTDKVKAKDEVYASLPFCCLYREGEEGSSVHHPK